MATVGQLMSSDLSVITEDATVKQAAGQMQDQRIGSLLVKKGERFFRNYYRDRRRPGRCRTRRSWRRFQWFR